MKWNIAQKSFFHDIAFLAVFKHFPSSEIVFWPFLKLQKMEFGQKKFSWNWFIWFHKFFVLDFFKFSGLLWTTQNLMLRVWSKKEGERGTEKSRQWIFRFHWFQLGLDSPGHKISQLNLDSFRYISCGPLRGWVIINYSFLWKCISLK